MISASYFVRPTSHRDEHTPAEIAVALVCGARRMSSARARAYATRQASEATEATAKGFWTKVAEELAAR